MSSNKAENAEDNKFKCSTHQQDYGSVTQNTKQCHKNVLHVLVKRKRSANLPSLRPLMTSRFRRNDKLRNCR